MQKTTNDNQGRLMTFDETVKYLGVSKSFMYKLTSAKEIPHYKLRGKLLYFDREEVEEWILKNRVSTNEEIQQKAGAYTMRKGGMR